MTTNSQAGRRAALAGDALTEYDHLPPVGVHAHASGRVHLTPDGMGGTTSRIVAVARWAAAFDVPATLGALSPSVTATVQLGGRVEAQLYVILDEQELHELAVRLGVQPERGGSVEVTAEQLLGAVHAEQAESVAAETSARERVVSMECEAPSVTGLVCGYWHAPGENCPNSESHVVPAETVPVVANA